jgi:hypothetical protein
MTLKCRDTKVWSFFGCIKMFIVLHLNIKWSLGFDGRCSLNAYTYTFVMLMGILPEFKNMCTQVKTMKLLIKIFSCSEKIIKIVIIFFYFVMYQNYNVSMHHVIMHYVMLSSWVPWYICIVKQRWMHLIVTCTKDYHASKFMVIVR